MSAAAPASGDAGERDRQAHGRRRAGHPEPADADIGGESLQQGAGTAGSTGSTAEADAVDRKAAAPRRLWRA